MARLPENDKVAEWFASTRETFGLSQRDFAARLREKAPFVDANFVARTESGQRELGLIEFIRICEALGAKPERIFATLLRSLRE